MEVVEEEVEGEVGGEGMRKGRRVVYAVVNSVEEVPSRVDLSVSAKTPNLYLQYPRRTHLSHHIKQSTSLQFSKYKPKMGTHKERL